MLLQRQIVKALSKRIDIEYPERIIYAITSHRYLDGEFISVNVTTYRTTPAQRCQTSSRHCIIMITTKLRSYI
jgi:hypothetical protein